jgi:hypothetical protein
VADWLLALRLARGAGRPEAVRLVLLVLGVAAAVVGLLVGAAAPRVSAAAQLVEQAREGRSVGVAASDSGLRLQESQLLVDGRRWSRVVVAGAGSGAPRPPGVASWPQAGHSLVSPALAAVLAASPDLRPLAPLPSGSRIGEEGLASPDELVSYTVLDSLTPARGPIGSFGSPGGATEGAPAGLRFAEILLLIVGPAVVFLFVLLRAAVRARRDRMWALTLAGMSPSRCERVFTREVTLVAMVGSLVGVGAYAVVQAPLGRSGLLGIRWWPSQGVLPAWAVLLVVLCTVAVVRLVGRRAIRRALVQARSDRSAAPEGSVAWWSTVYVLLPAVSCLAWLCVQAANADGPVPDRAYLLGMAATLVAAVGLVLAVPHVVMGASGALAKHVHRPDVRLGLRRAGAAASQTGALVAALAVVTVATGVAAGLLLGTGTQVFGPSAATTMTLSLDGANQATRRVLADLPVTLVETSASKDGRQLSVDVAECPALVRAGWVTPSRCRDAAQLGWGAELTGDVAVPLTGGGDTVIPVPAVTSDGLWDVKVPPADAPWILQAATGTVTLTVPRGTESGAARALLAAQAGLAIDAGHTEGQGPYEEQVGLLRAALAVGTSLSMAAFLIVALEVWWSGRRSTAMLYVLGAPRRAMRRATVVQLAFPLLVGGLAALLVATLAGWSIRAAWAGAIDPGVPAAAAVPVVLAVVIALVVGWMAGRLPPSRSALVDR